MSASSFSGSCPRGDGGKALPNGRAHRWTPLTQRILIPFFFFNDTATTEIYTLSLHDALPIWCGCWAWARTACRPRTRASVEAQQRNGGCGRAGLDRGDVGVDVGELFVGELPRAVRRHVLARRAHLEAKAFPRKRVGRELGPRAALAALPDPAVAGGATVIPLRPSARLEVLGKTHRKKCAAAEKKQRPHFRGPGSPRRPP